MKLQMHCDGRYRAGRLACRTVVVAVLAICMWTLAERETLAQDTPASDIATKSLPLRTALHHDPTMASPLERLLSMYRDAGQANELIEIYQAHVAQYPNDASARTVFVRLLVATGSPEATRAARGAVEQFPKNAYLHYVLYEILHRKQDPDALKELDQAIEFQMRPGIKVVWIDQLLPAAVAEDQRELAEKHLDALAATVESPQQRLEVAQRMNKYKFFAPALKLLEKEGATPPSPETMVSIELEAAKSEIGLKKTDSAAARLDRLLAKLTIGYWRRNEIVRRRLQLMNSESDRETMIADARARVKKNPRDEAAVLDLAQVLVMLQLRREALTVLLDAGRRLPKSVQIEKRTLDLLDRLRDSHGREKYLAERIERQPDRRDLMQLHVKTLYLLGRPGDALAKLTEAADAMQGDEKSKYLLQMARFLRRSLLPTEAAKLFQKVVESNPSRLDVRRELAEIYLAMGDRQRVRKLFRNLEVKQADLENLLDMVQFMMEQELLPEARKIIAERLDEEKQNFDLNVLMLTIQRRLGDRVAGENLIAECRDLADTGSRYRLWLESAVTFHEDFDSLDAFVQAEQARLDEDPSEWTTRRLERRLAFAEIADRAGHKELAVAMLQGDLDDDLPLESRIKLRRQLVSILKADRGQTAIVEQELAELAKEDLPQSDEYRAQLALLHVQNQRQDLAMGLLDKIDVSRIRDPAILRALLTLYQQHPEGRRQILPILERLTVLNPTDRNGWERWLTALATTGNETRLRIALRRLLASSNLADDQKLALSDETRSVLQSYLADSYWRDIAKCLVAQEQETSLAEALSYLDAVEPMAGSDQQWLWIAWIRAYLLSRMERKEAFDEAMNELQQMASRIVRDAHLPTPTMTDSPDDSPEGSPDDSPEDLPEASPLASLRIVFPDGLSVSFDHARKMLAAPPPPPSTPRAGPRQGPVPRLQVKWTYQTDPTASLANIVPLGSERMLIADVLGDLHCLATSTGKFLWRRRLLPASHSSTGVSAVPLADGNDQFYIPSTSQVSCHAVEDGRLLWQADVGSVGSTLTASSASFVPTHPHSHGSSPPMARPFVSIFHYENKLLTYDPISGTVTKIDPQTGKIVWDRVFAAQTPVGGRALWHNTGASLLGHQLMIYGGQTAIIDLRSGEIQWSFEPSRVRKFPVKLGDPAIQRSAMTGASTPVYRPIRYSGYSGPGPYTSLPPGSYRGSTNPSTHYVSYLQDKSSIVSAMPSGAVGLTAPAVVWASNLRPGTSRRAILLNRRLLLFDQTGMQIVHTDLPLAGKRVAGSGRFVGMAGRMACRTLDGSQLQFVDVTDGSVKSVALQEIVVAAASTPGTNWTPIQVTIDGCWVYVTGQGGILCINAISGRRMFRADWPAELAPKKLDKLAAVTGSTNPSAPVSHHFPGAHRISMKAYSGGAYPSPISYSHPPAVRNIRGAYTPPINCVDRGVLYTAVAPNRMVALQTEHTKNESP